MTASRSATRGHRARPSFRVAATAVAVALLTLTGPTMAAAPTPQSDRHCAVGLTQPAGGGLATIVSETCFATFAEAISFATAGRAKVGPDFQPASLTADIVGVPRVAQAGEVAVVSRWTLGNDYKGLQLTGESRTYFVDGINPPCANGVVWEIDSLDAGWSNVIRSAQGWSGCNHFAHYDLANQQGAFVVCLPTCLGMGALDRKATSLRWWQ